MTAPYLRRGVEGRSTHVCQIAARQLNRVRILATCKPEIPDLRSARGSLTALRRDQHVCRLEIAVHQPAIVQLLHAPEHAQEEGQIVVRLHVSIHVPAARRLHHDEVALRALGVPEVLDDVRVAKGCPHQVHLVVDVLCGQALALLHDLHGNFEAGAALQRGDVHRPVGTFPDFPGVAQLALEFIGPVWVLRGPGDVQQDGGPLLVCLYGRAEGLQVTAARSQPVQMGWGALRLQLEVLLLEDPGRPRGAGKEREDQGQREGGHMPREAVLHTVLRRQLSKV
mmetsp:Transcript_79042/g.246138  ORF Transcript_79042/g.246138 Transcript_79042/m.246138 type:complete len:282 (-) Transcript_79042:17-862(-)